MPKIHLHYLIKEIASGIKGEIVGCCKVCLHVEESSNTLDMPAVVNIIQPQQASIFGDYAGMHLLLFMENLMESLEYQARVKILGRLLLDGCKYRTQVSKKIPIPKGKDWQACLIVGENKTVFFQIHSNEILKATSTSKSTIFDNKRGACTVQESNQPI